MKAIIDGDLVVGRGSSDMIEGPEIPDELAALPLGRLRYKNGKIIDANGIKTFYLDEAGRKHIEKKKASWVSVSMAWDDRAIEDGGSWRKATGADIIAPNIKDACAARIVAVMGRDAQLNILARGFALSRAKGQASKTDKDALDMIDAAWAWVAAMQTKARELIEQEATDWEQDYHWPSPPDGLAEFAAKF